MNIALDGSTHGRYSHYASVVGKPIEQVICKALNRYMDDFGDVVLQSYQELADKQRKASMPKTKRKTRSKSSNVVAFPSR